MLFTTKELAHFFSQNEQWVYNITRTLSIKPVKKEKTFNGLSFLNFYSVEQKNIIEQSLITKNTVVIENNYMIYESKINFQDDDDNDEVVFKDVNLLQIAIYNTV